MSPVKNQPATPLPWIADNGETNFHKHRHFVKHKTAGYDRILVASIPQRAKSWSDASYIAHAANAYPKLVETLHTALAWARENKQRAGTLNVDQMSHLLADLGEYSK